MLNFGMLLTPTMYRSNLNYQMTSGSLCGSMNLHMNQCWTDLSARQNLYNVPIMNFGNFTPYNSFSTMNYLLDPGYAATQYIGMQMSSGQGVSIGSTQMPTIKSGLIGVSGTSEDEKTVKKQYEKLQLLLKNCLNLAGRAIAQTDRESIEKALKKNGKWSEKLDALKEAYKKLDEKVIKKSITQLQSEDKKIDYQTLLKDIGYNFDNNNSYNSDCNDNLKGTLKEFADKCNYDGLREYVKDLDLKTTNVLNLISTSNDYQIGLVSSLIGSDVGIPKLTNALIEKAESIKEDVRLSKETISDIEDLITSLKENLNEIYDNPSSTLIDSQEAHIPLINDFYDLYLILRLAETKMAQQTLQNDYGFTADISKKNSNFIKDDNLLIEETIQDLVNEDCFTEDEINQELNKIKLTA